MRTPIKKPPAAKAGNMGALDDLIRVFAGRALREFEKQVAEEEQAKTGGRDEMSR